MVQVGLVTMLQQGKVLVATWKAGSGAFQLRTAGLCALLSVLILEAMKRAVTDKEGLHLQKAGHLNPAVSVTKASKSTTQQFSSCT